MLIMNRFAKISHAHGFSLVEIMVAMVIGLLGMLVIFQVFSVSEGYRRTTTGGGDAQQNGAVGLYVLAKELRQSGWGFNKTTAIGCAVVTYDSNQGGLLAEYTLTPVEIKPGPANGSDEVDITYGNQSASAAPTPLTVDQGASTDAFTVKYPYGYAQDDLVLLVEATQPKCTVAQLTSLGTGATSTTFYHDPGASNSRYNKPGGSGISYSHSAWMYNLGPRPSRNRYEISNGTLTVVSAIASSARETVADGIVQMKAQYGKDNGLSNGTVTLTTYAADDGVVDRFDSVSPLTTSAWAQVLAVRIGVVARSAQPEKPNGTGACDATTAAPTWAGGTFDLSADPSWQCYRYKVFQTTVPIRNMLWSQG
jgi:type IV pilus assembly protein PilW